MHRPEPREPREPTDDLIPVPAADATECNVLQPKRARALELAIAGYTASEIADELRVHRVTVWRWSRDPAFKTALRIYQQQSQAQLWELMERAIHDATAALTWEMQDRRNPPAVRVRAATALLDKARHYHQHPAVPEPSAPVAVVCPECDDDDQIAAEQFATLTDDTDDDLYHPLPRREPVRLQPPADDNQDADDGR